MESGATLETLGEALYLDRDYAAASACYERAYAEVWLTGTVETADVRPGGKIAWEPDEYGQLVWDIVDVEPGHKLTYREGPGILPVATEVTVVFEEAKVETRLTVTQSGFGAGVDWQAQIDNVGLGWTQTLAALDLYLRTGVRLDRFFTFRSDLGLNADDVLAGPLVRTVNPYSFAARAGVEPGDVVVRLGDAPIFGRTAPRSTPRSAPTSDALPLLSNSFSNGRGGRRTDPAD